MPTPSRSPLSSASAQLGVSRGWVDSVPLRVLAVAGAVALVGLWLFYSSPGARLEREQAALRDAEAAGAGETAAAPEPPPSLDVEAFPVQAAPAAMVVDVSGVLEPVRTAVIGAEVAGSVVEVAVEENAHVRAGDLLVRLDPALPRAAVERAEAAVLRARAADRLARTELARQRSLAERGVASASDLDRAESEASSAAAEVASAQAALVDARTRLDKTRILAPFAGVVNDCDLEPGAYLRPGEPVAELVDLSELEVEIGVSDRQILALEDGARSRIAVDVYPGEWFEGRILRRGRALDSRTRKYSVPIRVPNPDERLLSGMLATVRLELGGEGTALRVPRRALLQEFELDYVYELEAVELGAATGDGSIATARRRRVTTRPVAFRPDWVEVLSGIAPGGRVATSRVRELRDGARVRVRELDAPTREAP